RLCVRLFIFSHLLAPWAKFYRPLSGLPGPPCCCRKLSQICHATAAGLPLLCRTRVLGGSGVESVLRRRCAKIRRGIITEKVGPWRPGRWPVGLGLSLPPSSSNQHHRPSAREPL